MEYYFSTDKEKLDVHRIHAYISKESYWGRDRTLQQVRETIEHSVFYGKKLMAFIMDHGLLKSIGTIALKTKDAQGLYAQFGVERVGNSLLWMARDNTKL